MVIHASIFRSGRKLNLRPPSRESTVVTTSIPRQIRMGSDFSSKMLMQKFVRSKENYLVVILPYFWFQRACD